MAFDILSTSKQSLALVQINYSVLSIPKATLICLREQKQFNEETQNYIYEKSVASNRFHFKSLSLGWRIFLVFNSVLVCCRLGQPLMSTGSTAGLCMGDLVA